jgi:hypothetical protein
VLGGTVDVPRVLGRDVGPVLLGVMGAVVHRRPSDRQPSQPM